MYVYPEFEGLFTDDGTTEDLVLPQSLWIGGGYCAASGVWSLCINSVNLVGVISTKEQSPIGNHKIDPSKE